MTKRERESFAAASTAGREAFARAVSARRLLKPRDWRVLIACLTLTALYSRTSDRTTVGQVADLSGASISRTSESLNRLADCGVISWKPSRVRGASHLSLLGAQTNPARIFKRQLGRLAEKDDPQ